MVPVHFFSSICSRSILLSGFSYKLLIKNQFLYGENECDFLFPELNTIVCLNSLP